jgi:Ca2+/Na+ antiporter
MRNPLRSEAEAYRFLLLTIGYFALIVAASLVNRWLGLAVFVLLTLAVLYLVFRRGEREPAVREATVRRGAENERRILVLANETAGGAALRDRIRERSAGYEEQVLVVTPALNSRARHWASDDADAREEAELRLRTSLKKLAELGIDARGEVGDAEPLQALEDAVRAFGPDEIIISTHPEGRSHWLERGVVDRARERYECPVTHVVVDLAAESEEVRT